MTDLGPDARSFLDSVRDADDPSPADAARIRAGVAVRLGTAVAAGAAATLGTKGASAGGAGAASAATAAMGSALATKVLVALVVVGGTVGASAVALRPSVHPAPPLAVASSAPLTANVVAGRAPEAAAAVLPSSEPPAGPKPAEPPSPAASAAPRVDRSASPAPGAAAAAGPSRPARSPTPAPSGAAAREVPDSLLEEAALVRAANTALSSGDPTTALARLDDHAARFPGGALGEERSATRVHALCAAGRVAEARAAATAFVSAHPRSSLAPAVRRSCTTE